MLRGRVAARWFFWSVIYLWVFCGNNVSIFRTRYGIWGLCWVAFYCFQGIDYHWILFTRGGLFFFKTIIFIFSLCLKFLWWSGYSVQVISKHYASKVSWIKNFLSHIDINTRESAARLLGIASSALTTSASSAVIEELLTSINGVHNLRCKY